MTFWYCFLAWWKLYLFPINPFFPTNFQEITLHGLLWALINSNGCHSNLFVFKHCKIWRGGGTCPHPNSAAPVQSKEFWIRKVKKHIYIHFYILPLNIMCLYPALFYDIFITSSMTFSPIYIGYSIYHCFIIAKSYNGMKYF